MGGPYPAFHMAAITFPTTSWLGRAQLLGAGKIPGRSGLLLDTDHRDDLRRAPGKDL